MVSPEIKRSITDLCRLMPWGPSYQDDVNELLKDEWLARKVDRDRRLKEHATWLNENVPEMFKSTGGVFVDIGPGPGESLEIARAIGHSIYGFDAPTDVGGMGSAYLQYSRLMHFRQMLNVKYVQRDVIFDDLNDINFIVMRGSIEQVFHDCMIGEPHHIHHKAKDLKWDTFKGGVEMARFLSAMWDSLARGGVVAIAANGCANNAEYEAMIKTEARHVGFKVIRADSLENCLSHRLIRS